MNKKLIFFLLLMIIIFSSILIYKIEQTPKYDPELYAQIYKEYEHIISISSSSQKNENITINSTEKKEPIVIFKNSSGNTYGVIGTIEIPKINVSYPIINSCTEENLNIAPTKLLGPIINTPGNLVIVGHNNWNKEFFSNLHKLENGDTLELTDTKGNKLTYKVYDKYQIKQDDFSCLEQNTDGKTELTLITCIKYQKSKRLVVKCVAN